MVGTAGDRHVDRLAEQLYLRCAAGVPRTGSGTAYTLCGAACASVLMVFAVME